MKYRTATIDAHAGGGPVSTFDLEGLTLSDLYAQAREAFGNVDADEDGDTDPDEAPSNVTWSNPQGFAVHLFEHSHPSEPGGGADCSPVPNFDELLEAWTDETDDDRREAMGEYLEDMGADDLSDFDEAYQGQHSSGADFAEYIAEEVGDIPKDLPSWICIDWERSWAELRFDYHMTNSGHVFRHL
jgi:hypothetical protein